MASATESSAHQSNDECVDYSCANVFFRLSTGGSAARGDGTGYEEKWKDSVRTRTSGRGRPVELTLKSSASKQYTVFLADTLHERASF